MNRRLANVLLLASVSACTSYEPSPGEPVAKLRLMTYASDMTELSMQDLRACPERKQIIYKQLSGLLPRSASRLGMAGAPEPKPQDFEEMVIPASHKAAMVVGSSRTAQQFVPGYRCEIGVLFEPRPDGQYELHYRYENNRCAVQLYQIRVAPDAGVTRAPEPTARLFGVQQYADQCAFR